MDTTTKAGTAPATSEDLARAARAVAGGGLRPGVVDAFRRQHGKRDYAEAIQTVMEADTHLARTEAWWAASGSEAILSTQALTGTDEGTASWFIGAALHALILAGSDTTVPAVVRVAERALAWDAGHRGVGTAGR